MFSSTVASSSSVTELSRTFVLFSSLRLQSILVWEMFPCSKLPCGICTCDSHAPSSIDFPFHRNHTYTCLKLIKRYSSTGGNYLHCLPSCLVLSIISLCFLYLWFLKAALVPLTCSQKLQETVKPCNSKMKREIIIISSFKASPRSVFYRSS